jgi:hypothetical protein
MEAKALKSNIRKTKVMISENYADVERTGKWLRISCGKRVNSVQCKWRGEWALSATQVQLWMNACQGYKHTGKHGSQKMVCVQS